MSELLARKPLSAVMIPVSYNYIGVFLTLDCNLRCSYCINRFGEQSAGQGMMSGEDWLRGLNRIVARKDLPISLQGGEPTVHPEFHAIVNGITSLLDIDLLTNLETDLVRFMAAIAPGRLKRDAPYASIRVSYHPEVMKIEALAAKVLTLLDAGYSVGIWGVLHPAWETEVMLARDYCLSLGIDFRTKEFLGEYESVLYGHFTYPAACEMRSRASVQCRPTELLIGPEGDIYRCHADLYAGHSPVGHILEPDLCIDDGFRPCNNYGYCNPCDVKTKTNRFQADGHTSVEIRFDR